MTDYLATFYTHLAALRTQKALEARGVAALMRPVPRSLSASCGVCVRYAAQTDEAECFHRDWEGLYRCANGGYELVKSNEAV